MTNCCRIRRCRRKGAALPLLAIMLPVALILAAMAINLSYMELCRTELYIATDAATRAAGRSYIFSGDEAVSMAKARELAELNNVAGVPLQLDDSDFVFGESVRSALTSRYSFTPGGNRPNAIEITGRRTPGSLDGPMQLIIPSINGRDVFSTEQMARSTTMEVDVALVLDRSGSMAYAANEPAVYPPLPASAPPGWFFCDPAPPISRWRDLVAAVDVFLAELTTSPSSELVSLSTYSDNSRIDQHFTSDYTQISAAVDAITQNYCSGRTAIGEGIREGANTYTFGYDRPWAAKVIIVLTDGIHNTGMPPKTAAKQAADAGITIFTITFSEEAEQTLMQEVAEEGLGKHFHATDAATLAEAFREIARSLPTLLIR